MTETMSKKDFAGAVRSRVEDRLGDGYEVSVQNVTKNNGTEWTAVLVKKDGESIAPTVYIDDYYHASDEDVEDYIGSAADYVVSMYSNGAGVPDIDTGFMYDYAKARERICFRLINAEKNTERLESLPYRMFQDLAVVFFIPVDIKGDEPASASAAVTIQMMEHWGVDTDELFRAALENTPALFPVSSKVLGDMLGEMTGVVPEMPVGGPQIHVVTNGKCVNGAAVALYPGFLKAMGERIGSDYFILPSSIHELLLLPDSGETDAQALRGMVMDVNASTVSAEEFLSDNVYRYSREKDSVSIV